MHIHKITDVPFSSEFFIFSGDKVLKKVTYTNSILIYEILQDDNSKTFLTLSWILSANNNRNWTKD